MASIRDRKLEKINQAIIAQWDKTLVPTGLFSRLWVTIRTYFSMIHYEFLKNDVAIRAQSLSYFTLFSILPLIAGVFLILGFFSQWGPVQKEFENLMANTMSSIPAEQRDFLLSYILQFKDQYLRNLSEKSGRIGVFAILVLFWIAARVFFNIESLMNQIWAVRAERPWVDRIKNFSLTMVFLPLMYALVISLPRIVEHHGNQKVGVFLDQGLLILVIFSTLLTILKGFPNTRVSWRSAACGAVAGTIGYAAANTILRIYFRFGTDTAYGKAGVLPVFAFFIYVAWLIFIFAVEVGLLVERRGKMLERRLPNTTLGEALILEKITVFLNENYLKNAGPQSLESICSSLALSEGLVLSGLEFLEKAGLVVRTPPNSVSEAERFLLCASMNEAELSEVLHDYLETSKLQRTFQLEPFFQRLLKRNY